MQIKNQVNTIEMREMKWNEMIVIANWNENYIHTKTHTQIKKNYFSCKRCAETEWDYAFLFNSIFLYFSSPSLCLFFLNRHISSEGHQANKNVGWQADAKVTYSMFKTFSTGFEWLFWAYALRLIHQDVKQLLLMLPFKKKIWNYMIESFFIVAKKKFFQKNMYGTIGVRNLLHFVSFFLFYEWFYFPEPKKNVMYVWISERMLVFWCEKKCCRRQNHIQPPPVNRTNSNKSVSTNRVPCIDFGVGSSHHIPKLTTIVILSMKLNFNALSSSFSFDEFNDSSIKKFELFKKLFMVCSKKLVFFWIFNEIASV